MWIRSNIISVVRLFDLTKYISLLKSVYGSGEIMRISTLGLINYFFDFRISKQKK